MANKFLPIIDIQALKAKYAIYEYDEVYDMLAQPLHEELYKRQSFDFINELSDIQKLLLSYDYLRTQAGQGGFIQFIQNGYISLLPDMVITLEKVGAGNMAKVIDDVLKVYVLNRELLDKQTTVQEFALLYEELKEFEELDKTYEQSNQETIKLILAYAMGHLGDIANGFSTETT